MTSNEVQALGRLRWSCRRGIRELDVLLTRYVDEQYSTASAADQEAFRQLLEAQNAAIYAYCLGQETPPTAELRALIGRITSGAAAGR
jgi:antitoxin CptB